MRAGTRRLLLLDAPVARRVRAATARQRAQLALAGAPHGSGRRGDRGRGAAAVDALIAEAGGPAWDEAGFARLRGAGRRSAWPSGRRRCSSRSWRSSTRARDGRSAAGGAPPARCAGARATCARQLGRLVYPGFVARPARRGWPTSSATCAPPRAGSSGSRTRRAVTATGCAGSRSSRRAYERAVAECRAAAGCRRLREVPLDARGAARQPLRAGARHARAGVEQADPARARGRLAR